MVLARSPSVLWRRMQGAVLLLRPGEQEVVELAGSGVALWEALETPRTDDDLVGELARRYGTDVATVGPDTMAAVEDLLDRGVLRRVSGP